MDWAIIAKVSFNIILLILGLNALIIVHEFGHFAVARLCGVRCQKFYIWFDFFGLKFFKFKWGDTEYGLGLFPLGGYVKMLGQEDNPSELKAEMERAKQTKEGEPAVNASNEEAPVQTRSEEELNEVLFAPDSYMSKSVPQRMAIIVAGVAMNFLFAIVCAAAAYLIGVIETAPVAGNVIPGSPAWKAGLQSGDRITAINGTPVRMFTDINLAMVGSGDGVKLSIDRIINGKTEQIEKELTPRKRKNDLAPSIGVTSMPSMEIASAAKPVYPWAEKFYLPGIAGILKKEGTDKKWHIAEVNGIPVTNYAQFLDESMKKNGEEIPCKLSNGTETVEITLPAIPMRETGIRFQTGTITMVLPDSDAAKKGIEAGDTIVQVDGKNDFDPLKLPQYILGKVNEGKTTAALLIKKKDGTEKQIDIELAPKRIIPNVGPLSMKDPVGSTALGLSWEVLPVIAGFDGNIGNPAKLPSFIGGTVTDISFLNSEPLLRSTTFASADENGYHFHEVGNKIDIPYIFDTLLQLADSKEPDEKEKAEGKIKKPIQVSLTIDKDGQKMNIDLMTLQESTDWFNTDRGLMLKSETTLVKCDDLATALSMGTAKMIDYSLSIFNTLHALFAGSVSPRALGGPVMIVQAAYMYTEKGMGAYLLFLCLIGANLAVINILPVPVLDGGHFMFLLYEGIFRRPPNTTVLIILSYIGLFLILALMVWALSLDVSCIKRL
ncbi:metalloprotease [Planctomycetales bacterium]|nr:metalloprotease [Planctomycetales bacterium]